MFSFTQKLKGLFSGNKIDEEFFDNLTDILVEGDIGAKMAFEITDTLEKICKTKKISEEDKILDELESILLQYAKPVDLNPDDSKTTTAAKIANLYKNKGKKVIMAAADTFRAAAEEQLEMHGKNLNIRVIAHQHGSDPSAVVFDAADAARAGNGALVIADTAGRLHNKENLVRELQKID